ncbi:hypothetical protein CDAR_403241 [Caerostris darwini]|uniref:Uncharacterized protein n=1 Tax=Caerostris darwini TaxID=1538125 RepID=A0AAV4S696_9ARAC|nr:hypothetical protein CDAR_403241 [Caerostris darwini]
MSQNRSRDIDFERKRSNSLPTPSNVIFKKKEVVKFFSRRNSSDGDSSKSLESINFFMERNTYPELEVSDSEERLTEVCSKIHLHPKARYATKLPTPQVQEPETWKQRFRHDFRNFSRRMRRYLRH